ARLARFFDGAQIQACRLRIVDPVEEMTAVGQKCRPERPLPGISDFGDRPAGDTNHSDGLLRAARAPVEEDDLSGAIPSAVSALRLAARLARAFVDRDPLHLPAGALPD